LGYAVQLGTVRFLGTFLENPGDVPEVVVQYVAAQLWVTDARALEEYARSEARWDHTAEIRERYGYRDFSDPAESFRLTRWLYTRDWLMAERPIVLFDLATARLVSRKVLLPGVTVLARLVARVRDRVASRTWKLLHAAVTPKQATALETLLQQHPGTRTSRLEVLRNGPTRSSGPALLEALERLEHVRSLGVRDVDVSHIPPARLKSVARYAAAAWAQTIARMPEQRKIATLLAFAKTYEVVATDDALDVVDLMVTDLLRAARRNGKKERMRTLGDLDGAALTLCAAGDFLLNGKATTKISAAFSFLSREALEHAVVTVQALARTAVLPIGWTGFP
jgi:hypothetical protein